MKDFIIVGQGIAGTVFSALLHQKGYSFSVIDEHSGGESSRIASGLFNPVIIKRMKMSWKGHAMCEYLHEFYPALEKILDSDFFHPMPIFRIFRDPGEQNDWLFYADKQEMAHYLDPSLSHARQSPPGADLGGGTMRRTGWVDTQKLLGAWRDFLRDQGLLHEKNLAFSEIEIYGDRVKAGEVEARYVVFCEGLAAHNNPLLPPDIFRPTKGETLLLKTKELPRDRILHFGHFLIPLGENKFHLGATYNWNDINTRTTRQARTELAHSLEKALDVPFEIIGHEAGIRPNTKDRRPLIGTHTKYRRAAFLNGLGSRGILMAPWLGERLLNHLTEGEELPREADIRRFY